MNRLIETEEGALSQMVRFLPRSLLFGCIIITLKPTVGSVDEMILNLLQNGKSASNKIL